MTTFENNWQKLTKSKKYRETFALWLLKRSVAFQIRVLRKKHCGSQAILAERSSLTQGVLSRAEDQEYGNLTFNTVGRIAAGLDMAFIGRFVPFSELVKFSADLSEDEFTRIPTFEEENATFSTLGIVSATTTASNPGSEQEFETTDLPVERRRVQPSHLFADGLASADIQGQTPVRLEYAQYRAQGTAA